MRIRIPVPLYISSYAHPFLVFWWPKIRFYVKNCNILFLDLHKGLTKLQEKPLAL